MESLTSNEGSGLVILLKLEIIDVRAEGEGFLLLSYPTFPLPRAGIGRKTGFSQNGNVFLRAKALGGFD